MIVYIKGKIFVIDVKKIEWGIVNSKNSILDTPQFIGPHHDFWYQNCKNHIELSNSCQPWIFKRNFVTFQY